MLSVNALIFLSCDKLINSSHSSEIGSLAEGLTNILFFSVTQIQPQASVVFIRGLSEDTTEDSLCNYLESTRRSGGGPVEELKITENSARVKFESTEGNYIFCKDIRNADKGTRDLRYK